MAMTSAAGVRSTRIRVGNEPSVRHPRARLRRECTGFTLTEVAISLGILALALGVVATSVSSASIGDLRAAAARIATMARAAYDQAALSGRIHRMVIDFGTEPTGSKPGRPAQVYVEVTEEKLRFDGGESVLARATPTGGSVGGWAALSSGLGFGADEEGGGLDGFLPGGVDELLGLGPRDADIDPDLGEEPMDGVFEKVAAPFMLDDELRVVDVWSADLGDTVREGRTYVYFFPHGYAQDALIHIGFAANDDDQDASFSIGIEALTGRAVVKDEYQEPPK